MYTCIRCGYNTKSKSNFGTHFKRKKTCKAKICDIDISFYCKILDLDMEDYKNQIIKIQMDQLKILTEKSKQVRSNIGSETRIIGDNGTVHNRNNIDNSVNINITVNTNDYKDTDYTFLGEKAIECICQDGSFDMEKWLKLIHFNKDIPENHNLRMTNRKERIIRILENGRYKEYGRGKKGLEKFFREKLEFIIDNPSYFEDDSFNASVIMEDDYFRDRCLSKNEMKEMLYEKMERPMLNGSIDVKYFNPQKD